MTSLISLVLGIVALIAGTGVLIWGSWIAYWHYATLSTGRSAEFQNPIPIIAAAGFALALGGFLAGLAIAAPRKPVRAVVEPTD